MITTENVVDAICTAVQDKAMSVSEIQVALGLSLRRDWEQNLLVEKTVKQLVRAKRLTRTVERRRAGSNGNWVRPTAVFQLTK